MKAFIAVILALFALVVLTSADEANKESLSNEESLYYGSPYGSFGYGGGGLGAPGGLGVPGGFGVLGGGYGAYPYAAPGGGYPSLSGAYPGGFGFYR